MVMHSKSCHTVFLWIFCVFYAVKHSVSPHCKCSQICIPLVPSKNMDEFFFLECSFELFSTVGHMTAHVYM